MKRKEENLETPIASLIDVVFLLIIFFVVTASMEKSIVDESINLAKAEYAEEAEHSPRTITINLGSDGRVGLGNVTVTLRQLRLELENIKAERGTSVPILVRGDRNTPYAEFDKLKKVLSETGFLQINLAALVED